MDDDDDSPVGMSGSCCVCGSRSHLLVEFSQRPEQKKSLGVHLFLTCIPTTPYMKKMMAMKAATHGRAWKDFTKVKSRVRIPSPFDNSFTTRRTRKRRKKETDIMLPGWKDIWSQKNIFLPDLRDMECKKLARLIISSSPGFDSW